MQKLVIIINGTGGSGKDTICDIIANHYQTRNVSAIDPIKEIATHGGWSNDKSLAGRKLLSTLKQSFIEYNNLPTVYLTQQLHDFIRSSTEEILLVHIREPSEISKFKTIVIQESIPCYTLLVMSQRITGLFGNSSDDNVNAYSYDFIYHNDLPYSELHENFMLFFELYILNRLYFETSDNNGQD